MQSTGNNPKPLFIINKVNQTEISKKEFRENCAREYDQLSELLTDYHVIYFANEKPDLNFSGINNYDVKYPKDIPDIAMSELLDLVEQNLNVEELLSKFRIFKEKLNEPKYNTVSFVQLDFKPNPMVHNGASKYRSVETQMVDYDKEIQTYTSNVNFESLKTVGWCSYYVDRGETPPNVQFIVNLTIYKKGSNNSIDIFLNNNKEHLQVLQNNVLEASVINEKDIRDSDVIRFKLTLKKTNATFSPQTAKTELVFDDLIENIEIKLLEENIPWNITESISKTPEGISEFFGTIDIARYQFGMNTYMDKFLVSYPQYDIFNQAQKLSC